MHLPIFNKVKNEEYYLNPEKYSNNIHILVTKNFDVYKIGIDFKTIQDIDSHKNKLININKNLEVNEFNQITFARVPNNNIFNYTNVENIIKKIFKYFFFEKTINQYSIVTIEVVHEGSVANGVGCYKDFM